MTLLVSVVCILLVWAEFGVYLDGIQEQHFAVDPSIGRHLQINVDLALAMPCSYIHVNVKDAAGDRIFAGEVLKKEPTKWDPKGMHKLSQDHAKERDDDLWAVMAKGKKRRAGTAAWPRTYPWTGTGQEACRIFGNMEVNKVQGNFHITAKGHGYWESGQHVDHNCKRFIYLFIYINSFPSSYLRTVFFFRQVAREKKQLTDSPSRLLSQCSTFPTT